MISQQYKIIMSKFVNNTMQDHAFISSMWENIGNLTVASLSLHSNKTYSHD